MTDAVLTDKGYSTAAYAALLAQARECGYTFAPFTQAQPGGKTIYLRHDIDVTLSFAADFAAINEREGAVGTFFLMLRSPLYNLLAPESLRLVERILDHGQRVGFHFATDAPAQSHADLAARLANEFALFSEMVPQADPVFAWHQTGELIEGGLDCLGADFPGLVNAYGTIGGAVPPYYSDSNMRYTTRELHALLTQGPRVFQLALAPMQWAPGGGMPYALAGSLTQKMRDAEEAFLLNSIYRERLPDGLPDTLYDSLRKEVAAAIIGEDGGPR